MTIAQALKEKNKKLNHLHKLWERVAVSNSVPEGNIREFNPEDILVQLKMHTDEYVILKTRIHNACAPVRGKIFKLSELKNYVKRLKAIDTKNGLYVNRYESVSMRYDAYLSAGKIDEMVEQLENEIDNLQEELDLFNHKTRL
jgi:hypothetical protein